MTFRMCTVGLTCIVSLFHKCSLLHRSSNTTLQTRSAPERRSADGKESMICSNNNQKDLSNRYITNVITHVLTFY